MAFEFGCFISYPHDDGYLIEQFMEEFVAGLKAHCINLDPDKKYWWDREQLTAGTRHPEAIASGMCKSACWILIYYPRYRRSEDCKKEYNAMRDLEERRKATLHRRLPRDKSMIIPVLFRGEKSDLPGELSNRVIFQDFSKYTASGPRIRDHPEFEQKMIEIADHVWDVWRACEDLEHVPPPCHEYDLPAPSEADWGPEFGGTKQGQPR